MYLHIFYMHLLYLFLVIHTVPCSSVNIAVNPDLVGCGTFFIVPEYDLFTQSPPIPPTVQLRLFYSEQWLFSSLITFIPYF